MRQISSEAYDRVSHEGLLAKLKLYGFHGKLLRLLTGMCRRPVCVCRDWRHSFSAVHVRHWC
ncbi:putative transposable element encoded protein [Trachipleistophora hominis]|uniref:Putative transposable element encoded protein n=1 Tax=Trachipleistophora hominis TaxID=72359 RepID=L7JXU8_TRAHO|nr:putative transposable element encoded protein [Trachipleistophora hominis]